MKKRIGIWIGLACSLLACLVLILVNQFKFGTKNKGEPDPDEIDAMITQVMREAEPNTHVTLGAFDSMIAGGFQATPEEVRTYTSSSILDAPRNLSVNVVVNEDEEERPMESVPFLLSSLAASNDVLGVVTITDRDGGHPLTSLSAAGDKMTVSKLGGFSYGEVYQIEIKNAPFLCFEGRDPSIRVLTVEIEDEPGELAEYDVRQLRDGIVTIDRTKIVNRTMDNAGVLCFDYEGKIPYMSQGDVFFASIAGKPDDQLDFYGVVLTTEKIENPENTKNTKKNEESENVWRITYTAPNITDVYRNFRLKGVQPLNLDEATVLLNESLVLEQFRNSSLAFALGRMMVDEFGFTPTEITNFMKEVNLSVNMNFVGNRLDYKITVKLGNFKIEDDLYFSFEFGYEKMTEYDVDFDVDVRTEWIIPCGVDYKVKMMEDSQSAFYFKVIFDKKMLDEIPADADYTAQLQEEMAKCRAGETNGFSALDGDKITPSTSGTRTTFPLFEIDCFHFSPLQIKFKVDCYLDLGLQTMGLFKTESHTRRVDFNFTNKNGAGQSDSTEIVGTNNWTLIVGGSARAEAGVRSSLGISILGFYDYLHAEAYAEAYVNATVSGLIGLDWNLTAAEFTGYVCADFNVTLGFRAGLNFKVLLFDYNLSKAWSTDLFRIRFDNALEHWSDAAELTVEMNGKRTVGIDETECLNLKYFDGTTLTMKEKKYKGADTFSILSGFLCPQGLIDLTSGNVFTYTSNNPELIEVDDQGTIHVKDGTPNEFTATFTVGVENLTGSVSDRTISVHFVAGDTREVYADDTLIGDYRPGYTIILPEAETIRGKAFDRYTYDGRDYKAGEPFTLPTGIDGSIVLEKHYHDLPLYRVYFYDGYNIMIGFDEVYQGESATPPYPELRDCHMDPGLQFFTWDRSYDNVQSDLHVVGIYAKVTEEVR